MRRMDNKRLKQYLIAIGLIVLITCLNDYRFDLIKGGSLFIIIFVINFLWYRENRRATILPSNNVNWHLFEGIPYLSSLIGFGVVAIYYAWPEKLFHSYFYRGALGFLGGPSMGEYLYQRTRLPKLTSWIKNVTG